MAAREAQRAAAHAEVGHGAARSARAGEPGGNESGSGGGPDRPRGHARARPRGRDRCDEGTRGKREGSASGARRVASAVVGDGVGSRDRPSQRSPKKRHGDRETSNHAGRVGSAGRPRAHLRRGTSRGRATTRLDRAGRGAGDEALANARRVSLSPARRPSAAKYHRRFSNRARSRPSNGPGPERAKRISHVWGAAPPSQSHPSPPPPSYLALASSATPTENAPSANERRSVRSSTTRLTRLLVVLAPPTLASRLSLLASSSVACVRQCPPAVYFRHSSTPHTPCTNSSRPESDR